MSQRTDRIDELLRQEMGAIIAREVADPRIGFVTITRVETARDLGHAIVRVSVIGTPEERAAAAGALGHAMPFIRHTLGGRLRLRRIPEFHVRLDDTAERGTRILRLIGELEKGGLVEPDAPVGESLPTPVPRLPHAGDLPEEPPTAAFPPPPIVRRRRAGRPATSGPRRSKR
jgi:ribosome-binding factor A